VKTETAVSKTAEKNACGLAAANRFILKFAGKEKKMSILKGKKVIIIGDRDGVPGEAIKICVEQAGGEVVFASTECFV